MKLLDHVGADPIPKDVMRHAAMAARLQQSGAPPGSEYDTQAGLDLMSNYVYERRAASDDYGNLNRRISARRGARDRNGSITADDIMLMSEIIWDLAEQAGKQAEALRHQEKHSAQNYLEETVLFFAERFTRAFPGLRGLLQCSQRAEIQERLLALLGAPLDVSGQKPIWWWRNGSSGIRKFEMLPDGTFLMNNQELDIVNISAVNAGRYYQSFVYVETRAMDPVLLSRSPEELQAIVDQGEYLSEDYGLVSDGSLVSISSLEDGAVFRDGKLVDLSGKAEMRIRYLTPYNFLIAAQGSPINSNRFTLRLDEMLAAILRGADRFAELVTEVQKLPRIDRR